MDSPSVMMLDSLGDEFGFCVTYDIMGFDSPRLHDNKITNN